MKTKKVMRLKKWVRNLVSIIFGLLFVLFGSLNDFEVSISTFALLLFLLCLWTFCGFVLMVDEERRWEEIFK